MLKKILLIIFSFTVVVLYKPACALDVRLQPRVKTGIQFYEFEQPALQSPARDAQGLFPDSQSSIEFNDWLPFISGGATLFVDRFFVDVDVQYLFDGELDSGFSNQIFIKANDGFPADAVARTNNVLNSDFDRFEWAVSAGFEVIDNLVIFGGYKHAKTKSNSNIQGDGNTLLASNLSPVPLLSGKVLGEVGLEFEYDGPFVGINYNWRIKHGFLDGGLSFNFAAAFLDSRTQIDISKVVVKSSVTGENIPLSFLNEGQGGNRFTELQGDSTGFSFGVGWQGLTSVQGLSYLVGVTGYRYEFEGNETVENRVRMDVGLSYAFDF